MCPVSVIQFSAMCTLYSQVLRTNMPLCLHWCIEDLSAYPSLVLGFGSLYFILNTFGLKLKFH